MNSRERVIKTYNFQIPDRIPLDFCADEPVYDALIKKVEVKDSLELMEYFHIDFRWAKPKWIGPELKTPDGKRTDVFGIPRDGEGFGYALAQLSICLYNLRLKQAILTLFWSLQPLKFKVYLF